MIHRITWLISFLLLATGCSDLAPLNDIDAPSIIILSPEPASGIEYTSDPDGNNSVRIHAEISDNDELHDISVYVVQDYQDGDVPRGEVMRRHFHPDKADYTLLDFWMIDTAYLSNIRIYIEATDHNLNYSKDSVQVYAEQ